MKKSIGVIGALTMGLGLALAGPTAANAEPANNGTIYVPDDFNPALRDTRATGHYDVVGTGLRVWTDGLVGSTNKVAEYVDADTLLADVGDPSLELTNTSGTIAPGFQLVIDVDGDGTNDGILVGEPTAPGYGDNWWLTNGADAEVKAQAPHTGGGYGSPYYGTLAEWITALPGANVIAFGFSLGSGVLGDWTINAINFADTRYTLGDGPRPVILTSKDECKNNGWATSTQPVYKNQGECVSSFASTKDELATFRR